MIYFFIGIMAALVLAYLIAVSMAISPRKRIELLHKTPDELAEWEREHGHGFDDHDHHGHDDHHDVHHVKHETHHKDHHDNHNDGHKHDGNHH